MRVTYLMTAGLMLAVAQPAVAQSLFGPGKFKVEQSDDRFSTDGTTVVSGKNNRISKKSVAGGIEIGGNGVYVEPVLTKRKADGAIVAAALFIHNETEHDTQYGSPNRIGTPRKITFLIDGGAPLTLDIEQSDSRWGDTTIYNTASRSASAAITESGIAALTPEQMRQLAAATSVVVKIDGEQRSVVYEAKDISKSFLPNLRAVFGQ